MTLPDRITKSIQSALRHIRKSQNPDGGFSHLSSPDPGFFSDAIVRHSTFFTSSILLCLARSGMHPHEVAEKGNRFLLSQRSKQWSFNYWIRDSRESKAIPYPDDLDDTFAALAAIAASRRSAIGGKAMAHVVKMLTLLESKPGGPYRTWLVPSDAMPAWQDIDVAVNANVGYFLSLFSISVPPLYAYICESVKASVISSPYYPGPFPPLYFISRYLNAMPKNNGDAGRLLADSVEAKCDVLMRNGTPLEQTMAISILVRFPDSEIRREMVHRLVESIVTSIENDGFCAYPFCIDPARSGKRSYAGSSALTAAFCAEALALYKNTLIPAILHAPARTGYDAAQALHERICAAALTECAKADPELRESARKEIDSVSNKEITTLPYEFRDALRQKGVPIPPEHIVGRFALANLYGWMAYAIQDRIMDRNANACLLPCANFFLRRLSSIYADLGCDIRGLQSLFRSVMDRIDGAALWEWGHCRLPLTALPAFGSHANLADRSIGHALGPLAMLLAAGYRPDSREFRTVERFFRHYLIARQLNDDAHDWADDLLCGQVSSVGAVVISHYLKTYPGKRPGLKDILPHSIPELRRMFWEKSIITAARLITLNVNAARHKRARSAILAGSSFMEPALERLERAAHRAIRKRDEALAFIGEYGLPFR